MSQPFDFDKALKALQSGQVLTGKDGVQRISQICIHLIF